MHPIRRLSCRAYQLAFRAALPVLPYHQPELLDTLEGVVPLLAGRGIRSILLVADGGVYNLGLTRTLEQALHTAGIAFTRSYVGYVHGLAHALGGQYGIAHGLANAVILPRFLRTYGDTCVPALARLARKAGIASTEQTDAQSAEAFIRWIEGMNRDFGLPTGFAEIREEDIPTMAAHADRECNPLYPVPRLMDRRELETMLHALKEDA